MRPELKSAPKPSFFPCLFMVIAAGGTVLSLITAGAVWVAS